MGKMRVFAVSAGAVLAMLLLTACPTGVTVADLQRDPGRYQDKEVGIKGTVTDSWGVLSTGAYQLDDGTGKIWVITSNGVPGKGAKVGVAGRVMQSFAMGGRNFTLALRETQRRR